jgi:hypothetical protein
MSLDLPSTSSTPPQDDRWATIIEPVTNSTLLDTLIAQLTTLTTLSALLPVPSAPALSFISTYAQPILDAKLEAYTIDTNRTTEAITARDDYICAFSDLQFRNHLIEIPTYYNTITQAYTSPSINRNTNPQALVKSAESHITFHHSVLSHPDAHQPSSLTASWEALSGASDALARASKLPDVETLAAIHVMRGDVEMLRWRMGRAAVPYEASQKYASALLKNAEVFYRGGRKLAGAVGAGGDNGMAGVEMEGAVKEAVVRGLRGEGGILEILKGVGEGAGKVLREMLEEGLVGRSELEGFGVHGI